MSSSDKNNLSPVKSFRDIVGPGLAGIPLVGGPISALWSQWETNRRFERVESTLRDLSDLLATLEDASKLGDLGVEDMQLLEHALERVQYAQTEDKRKQFARVITHCWTDMKSLPYDERMLFVDALSEFNEMHLQALMRLKTAGREGAVTYASLKETVTASLISDQDSVMIRILDALAGRYGFIKRAWGLNDPTNASGLLTSKNLSPEGIARKCNHAITPLGMRFVDSLATTAD